METSNTLLTNPLTLEFKKRKMLLKGDARIILQLKCGKRRATVKSGDSIYAIRNKGFWNATTMIEEGDKLIARMKRILGSNKVVIEFENETLYYLRSRNRVLTRLSIARDNKEIVRYKLVSKLKAHLNVDISQSEINEKDLLLLIALGYFVFRGILKENKTFTDKMIFTATVKGKPETEVI